MLWEGLRPNTSQHKTGSVWMESNHLSLAYETSGIPFPHTAIVWSGRQDSHLRSSPSKGDGLTGLSHTQIYVAYDPRCYFNSCTRRSRLTTHNKEICWCITHSYLSLYVYSNSLSSLFLQRVVNFFKFHIFI